MMKKREHQREKKEHNKYKKELKRFDPILKEIFSEAIGTIYHCTKLLNLP
jgi:hypothetical protein